MKDDHYSVERREKLTVYTALSSHTCLLSGAASKYIQLYIFTKITEVICIFKLNEHKGQSFNSCTFTLKCGYRDETKDQSTCERLAENKHFWHHVITFDDVLKTFIVWSFNTKPIIFYWKSLEEFEKVDFQNARQHWSTVALWVLFLSVWKQS